MTVIAYDGKTIAADSLSVSDDSIRASGVKQKLHHIGDAIVAAAGETDSIIQMLDAFRAGGLNQNPKPTISGSAVLLAVFNDGRVYRMTDSMTPEAVEAPVAIGCGYPIALGVMRAGGDAKRAVEVACELDIHCGLPVQTMEFYKGHVIEVRANDKERSSDYQKRGREDSGNLSQDPGQESFSKTPELTLSKIENCRRSLPERESERTRKRTEEHEIRLTSAEKCLEQVVDSLRRLEAFIGG